MDKKSMAQHIVPLNMDRLSGRMLHMKSRSSSTQEILAIYGHHSSLERMYSFVEVLADYGNVTMPDIPGLGGMESFYKLDDKPSIESFADYLAAFVKMRYKRKKVIIVGFSFSVPIIVKMLQKYPDLQKRVKFVVSVSGFVHKEDFRLSRLSMDTMKIVGAVGSLSVVSWFIDKIIFRPLFFRIGYTLLASKHEKMKGAAKAELKKRIDFEVELWDVNDVRTWFYTLREMMLVDLCDTKVDVELHHVCPEHDIYFNPNVVEQHLKIIFKKVKMHKTAMPNHAPSIIANKKAILPFFPMSLRKVLKAAG